MFVNKRWSTFYLSKAFYAITISSFAEHAVKKILHSSFDVGKYVKSIRLHDLQKPGKVELLDIHNDRLGMFMKKTPNVQEVFISLSEYQPQIYSFTSYRQYTEEEVIHRDWRYFSVSLINTNCWKLQFLPVLEDGILYANYYYTCAYYSRRTLKRLELSFSMLSPQDFYLLKDFTGLDSLEIHEYLVNGLDDFESLIQFTPKIQELTVRFASNRISRLI